MALPSSQNIVARAYQLEMFEKSIKQNFYTVRNGQGLTCVSCLKAVSSKLFDTQC